MNKDDNIWYIHNNPVNIGDIVYRLEDGYDDIWRVYNIYDSYGVDIRNVLTRKIKYVDANTFIDEYIKIRPHGYLELAAIKDKKRDYWDLRISTFANIQQNNGHVLQLCSSGVLYGPGEDLDSGEYIESPAIYNIIDSDWSGVDLAKYYWGDDYIFTKDYKVAISYYFGDTVEELLSFMDEILEVYIKKTFKDFTKKEFKYHPFDLLIDTIKGYNMILDILYAHGAVYIDIPDAKLTKYDMFDNEDINDDLLYVGSIPSYPMFVSHYKIYMDLNNIKNDYYLVAALDDNDNTSVFIVMTYKYSNK